VRGARVKLCGRLSCCRPACPARSPLSCPAPHLPPALGLEQRHISVSHRGPARAEPSHPAAGGCSWLLGCGDAAGTWPPSRLPSLCQSSRRGAPLPLEVLGALVLLYGGRLEKQKGRCPSPKASGAERGSPGAASLAGVPALHPPRRLPLAQQVGVDEDEELVGADGGDVALAVGPRLVQQHGVEVGAGEVQELPGGAGGSQVRAGGLRVGAEPAHPVQRARVLLEWWLPSLPPGCELWGRGLGTPYWTSPGVSPHCRSPSGAAGRGCL